MNLKTKNKNHMTVGVIGLGFMGTAISANIVKEGFAVWGYDVLKQRIDILVENGGQAVSSCREVAQKADVLLMFLPSLSAFQEVVWGAEGILSSRREGLIVMECSTLAVADKERACEDMRKAGMILMDCPISGGARAAQKDLVVYGSGPQDSYEKCIPVIEAFARSNYYLGKFGNGSKMKLVANLLVAIHNVSAAEAMVFGMKAGLDPEMIYKVMCDSSGRSRMFEVRAPRMVKNDYDNASMKIKIFQKDLSIIADFAKSLNCPTPLFSNSIQVYLGAMAKGFEEQDTASVCAVLEDWAQLNRK
ncbi:MAG: NAD(P)-dependent oxidoreductase [Desulfobacterales bacterium]|nr:NAD(P)-dependent oxidoreductase [Desulfobacterales bacterium]